MSKLGVGSFVGLYEKKKNHLVRIGTLKGVIQVVLVYFCRLSDSHLIYTLLPSFELFSGVRCLLVSRVGYNMSTVIVPV